MKALVLLLVAAAGLPAQTVVQKLFTNAAAPVTTSTTLIKNIGQFSHQVFLKFGGGFCTSPFPVAFLQFSFDGSTWVTFGSPFGSLGATASLSQVFSGVGYYNFVRFQLSSFDTVNCTATAWYSGGGGIPTTTVQGPVVAGSVLKAGPTAGTPWQQAPIFQGGYSHGLLAPLVVCDRTAQATVTAGNTTRLVTGGSPEPLLPRIQVCSFAITMSAAGQAQFVFGAGADCSTNLAAASPDFHLATATPLVMGSNIGGAVLFTDGSTRPDICLKATTGNADVLITYSTVNY